MSPIASAVPPPGGREVFAEAAYPSASCARLSGARRSTDTREVPSGGAPADAEGAGLREAEAEPVGVAVCEAVGEPERVCVRVSVCEGLPEPDGDPLAVAAAEGVTLPD